MRINKLSYKDSYNEWSLKELSFQNLTLLVGISGVGKTQILNAIRTLKKIAAGKSVNGVSWSVEFSADNRVYQWEGECELIKSSTYQNNDSSNSDEDDEKQPDIIVEKLTLKNNSIAERFKSEVLFNNKQLPKLSSSESLISLFKEEDSVKPAFDGFKKIIFRDHTEKQGAFTYSSSNYDIEKFDKQFNSIEEVKESVIDTQWKMYYVSHRYPDFFQKIKDAYVEVFPQVEEIKIEPLQDDYYPLFFQKIPIIQIKEKGVAKWIKQNQISSGMLRTLFHISEMFLLGEQTVILIDEFENSLGVNCINVLIDDLMIKNHELQFIVTSHHPYIINKIPYEYWKIVTRVGGKIEVFDASEYPLGESKHDRFINLINLQDYKEGIS